MYTSPFKPNLLSREERVLQRARSIQTSIGAHPFGNRTSVYELLPIVRGCIAVAEALPILESAPIQGGLRRFAELLDTRKWEEDIATIEWNYRDPASRYGFDAAELRSFAEYLRDHRPTAQPLRKDLSRLFGWPLQADFSAATVAYLKRLKIGLTYPDADVKDSCRTAFHMHTESMLRELRRSLACAFSMPLRAIPRLDLNLGPAAVPGENALRNSDEFMNWFAVWYALSVRWSTEVASIVD